MLICLICASLLFFCTGVLTPSYFFLLLPIIVVSFISYDRFATASRLASGLLCSLVSILFSLSVSDLALRYFINDGFSYRPDDQLLEHSPIWQGAYRYKPNQIVEKMSWGDLANFSCEENNREYRKVKFITDEHGFRNTTIMPNTALDIVVLGDSFALGSGVTQSQTFTSILASELKKRTYNLAVPGTPRSQVRDLLAEMSHLRIRNTTKLIWMIFEGNDLDEAASISKPIEAIKRSISQKYLKLFYTFQSSSPIRKLLGALWLDCTTADLVLKRVLPKAGTVLFFKPYESSMTRTFDAVSSSIGWKNIKLAFETM